MMTSLKRIQHLLFFVVIFILLGCDEDDKPENPRVLSKEIVHITSRISDSDGNSITANTPASTKLYTTPALQHQPVVKPDGEIVTLGEFQEVAGTLTAECTGQGTQINLELNGLIPNGVYTLWLFTYEAPGFDGTQDNRIGGGAFGPFENDQNAFQASATGKGYLSTTWTGGELSVFGSAKKCLIADEFEWHLVGTYHIDGKTHGAVPGPEGSEAFQFGFIFKSEQEETLNK